MQTLKESISIIERFEFKRGEKEALLGNGDPKWSVCTMAYTVERISMSVTAKILEARCW
jgi:hypothetical protein